MIFIDFETTGIPEKCDYLVEVLSLTASKVVNGEVVDTVSRYYYNAVQSEKIAEAVKINHLDHARITELRQAQGDNYPLFFAEDGLFWFNYFNDPLHAVPVVDQSAGLATDGRLSASQKPVTTNKILINAYNVQFDKQFLPPAIQEIAAFKCTMLGVNAFLGREQQKHLTLIKACRLFGIAIDESRAHNSDYDVENCIKVWDFIKNNPRYRKVERFNTAQQSKINRKDYMLDLKLVNGPERIMVVDLKTGYEIWNAIDKNPDAIPTAYQFALVGPDHNIVGFSAVNPYDA